MVVVSKLHRRLLLWLQKHWFHSNFKSYDVFFQSNSYLYFYIPEYKNEK